MKQGWGKAWLLALAFIAGGCEAKPGVKTHFQQGIEHFDAANYGEAAHEFGLACQEDGKNDKALFNRGLALLEAGKYDEAIASYEQFTAAYPEKADGRLNLAFAHAGAGNQEMAIENFQAAIQLDPTYAYPYCSFANYWLSKGHPDADIQAKELLDKAVEVGHQDSTAHYLHGVVMQRMGDHKQARADFERAVQLDADNHLALVHLADYEIEEGAFADAARRYIHAAVLDPDYMEAYLGAGVCHRELGNHLSSLQALSKALELDPDNPEINAELTVTALALLNARLADVLDEGGGNVMTADERASLRGEAERLKAWQPFLRKVLQAR